MSKHSRSGKRRPRYLRRRRVQPGEPPGIMKAPPKGEPTTVRAVWYGPDGQETRWVDGVDWEAGTKALPSGGVLWVRVVGLADVSRLEAVARRFSLHSLVLEDVLSRGQIPKVVEYAPRVHITALAPVDSGGLAQVDLVAAPGLVVSFEEGALPAWDRVLERIRQGRGRIRQKGADYLACCLLDAVVDLYSAPIEALAEAAFRLEEQIAAEVLGGAVHRIGALVQEMLALRAAVVPLRRVLDPLLAEEVALLTESSEPYFRDVVDHVR